MFKLDLEKAEEPEIKLPTFVGSSKEREFRKNIYICFTDYAKAFDCVDHTESINQVGKIWYPDNIKYSMNMEYFSIYLFIF